MNQTGYQIKMVQELFFKNLFIWVLQENISELVPGIKLVIAC